MATRLTVGEQNARHAALMDFFFTASRHGYAGDGEKQVGPYGEKFYEYEEWPFYYRDAYVTNEIYSSGQTLISFDGQPIWVMSYQGQCEGDDPAVLAFLKAVLVQAYESHQFCGGRGEMQVTLPDWPGLVYRNSLAPTFAHFRGRERILAPLAERGLKEIFWHEYQGMLLIPS